MFLIFEIISLILGIWILITGKIPAGFYKFVFGKKNMFISSIRGRLFGLVLASILPTCLVLGLIFGIIIGLINELTNLTFGSIIMLYPNLIEGMYFMFAFALMVFLIKDAKEIETQPVERIIESDNN